MALPYAFVTLLTSDHYLPGALALVAALRDVHPSPAASPEVDFQTVCLVTPETVDVSTIKLLRRAFDVVIGVELIAQDDEDGLRLLGRPDLNEVLTKLHVFRLTQYSKIIFLDADVLPIRPISHLFNTPHEFSAVPDVGWPDIFNSGVLVLSPGEEKFTELQELLKAKGSWDGGDQGILNEWRADDWNRLSFTYNTTPTAAYTYAPAYERFGKQISAIHFIGPNKPWKSIPYRAPFLSQQPQQQPELSQRAYDYDSLVDRWYGVYDKHYRSESLIPAREFEVQRYASAWDDQSGDGTNAYAGGPDTGLHGALGLEELRHLAIQGMTSASLAPDNRSGEGEYKSMPLEGRVDLMRPRPSPKKSTIQLADSQPHGSASPSPRTSPRTPGPNEIPPSPHPQPISLPPTPSLSGSDYTPHHDQHHQPQEHGYQASVPHQQQHEYQQPQSQSRQEQPHIQLDPQSQSHQEQPHVQFDPQSQPRQEQAHVDFHPQPPPRPASPPKLLWNPAIEPPPNTAPPQSAFPADTYFPNIWDQAPSKHRDRVHQHFNQTSPTPDSGAFFEPPPPPQIPESLRAQGHYRNVTGEQHHTASEAPNPDPAKVKPIFPWEEKPRTRPGRVFPASEAPPPTSFASPAVEEPVVKSPSPEPVKEVSSPPPSRPLPPRGLPASLSYANAWDTVPSIQRYADRLVRPPPPPPPMAGFDDSGYPGRKNWDDRADASSRDGDDEDNTDDDDEPVVSRLAEDSDNETSYSGSTSRTRSRRSSASYSSKSKKKEYRVRGVQTISPEMREQAVQVSILVDWQKVSESDKPFSQDKKSDSQETIRPPKTSLSLQTGGTRKPQWAPSAVTSALPPVVSSGQNSGSNTPRVKSSSGTTGRDGGNVHGSPFSPPSDALSPREFGFGESAAVARPKLTTRTSSNATVGSPRSSASVVPAVVRRTSGSPQGPTLSPLGPVRQISNDSSVTSPPSSVGPVSPSEGQPIDGSIPSPRKAGRVFDPARGVELFKRDSEEVLARFLKMSAWEEDSSPQR